MTATVDIETLVAWGPAKRVETKFGDRMLRVAQVTPEFWDAWRAAKEQLKAAGVSASRNDRGEWRVCWWQPIDPAQAAREAEAKAAALAVTRATDADIDVPRPPGLEFRGYQKAGVAFGLNCWKNGRGVLIGDEMGLGKTIQVIGLINATPEIQRVLICCPNTLKGNWSRELRKWLTRPMRIGVQKAGMPWIGEVVDIVIINYDIVHKFREVQIPCWDLRVTDECFPAGTMVKTTSGFTKIEEVRVGDYVCNAAGVGRVVAIGVKRASKLVRVSLACGTSIFCTPDHPFLTQVGFVKACELNQKHCIKTHNETLRILWSGIQTVPDETILRDILFSEMAHESTEHRCDGVPAGTGVKEIRSSQKNASRKSGACQGFERTNDCKESNEVETNQGGRFKATEGNWTWPEDSRRKRNWPDKSGGGAFDAFPIGEVELANPYRMLARIWLSVRLQSRFGMARGSFGSRGGRGKPFSIGKTTSGSEERVKTSGPWVVRVESIEPTGNDGNGCCGAGVEVYNLEVSGHPSYIVTEAELVVHNCHYLKNPKARRTKETLSTRAWRKASLTGTPVENRPIELWPIIADLDPQTWDPKKGFFRFARRYCDAKNNGFGWDFKGSSNAAELQHKLRSTILVRRLKADVLTELPPKRRQIIELEGDGRLKKQSAAVDAAKDRLDDLRARVELARASESRAEYEAAVAELEEGQGAAFAEMSALRLALGLAKLEEGIEFIRDALESSKVVVFGHHLDVIGKLKEAFPQAAVITGDTKADDRMRQVDRFQQDRECNVFIGNNAAAEGITLTAANHVIIFEGDWVPGKLAQKEDRCHRIGQKDSVLVTYLVVDGTLDCDMIKANVEKLNVIEAVLDRVTDYQPQAAGSQAGPATEAKAYGSRITFESLQKEALSFPPAACELALEGMQRLAGVCDGASQRDNSGFSGVDVRIGHSFARQARLTPKQGIIAAKICRKYRRQLGVEFVDRLIAACGGAL